MSEIKRQVREFYNQVGWQQVSEGVYQNARYEDLRPVSRVYIHHCHLRVNRHLAPQGEMLLDAGSGPIQYPEYLTYSQGYRYRVCADISIVALREARARIGKHGLFVVADVANLPFKADAFDGVVSLHTFHHVPVTEHEQAYNEVFRVLKPGRNAVIVNGWDNPPLTRILELPIRARKAYRRWRKYQGAQSPQAPASSSQKPKGTFVRKMNAQELKRILAPRMSIQIFVWRSVTVRWLRTFIRARWGGKQILQWLYALEERFPHFFGENGQYPLIVLRKDV